MLSNFLKMIGFTFLCALSVGHAATLEQLRKKNNDLIDLKADLEIAKTKKSIQEQQPQSAALVIPRDLQLPRKIKEAASPTAAIDFVEFIGAGGDTTNPTAKFLVGNASVQRRVGEQINGWQIIKITSSEVTFSKVDKKETLFKSIYLAATNRLTEQRRFLSPAQAQGGQPVIVPAVAQ